MGNIEPHEHLQNTQEHQTKFVSRQIYKKYDEIKANSFMIKYRSCYDAYDQNIVTSTMHMIIGQIDRTFY